MMEIDGNRWDLWFLVIKIDENIGKTSNFDEKLKNYDFFKKNSKRCGIFF